MATSPFDDVKPGERFTEGCVDYVKLPLVIVPGGHYRNALTPRA